MLASVSLATLLAGQTVLAFAPTRSICNIAQQSHPTARQAAERPSTSLFFGDFFNFGNTDTETEETAAADDEEDTGDEGYYDEDE